MQANGRVERARGEALSTSSRQGCCTCDEEPEPTMCLSALSEASRSEAGGKKLGRGRRGPVTSQGFQMDQNN